MYVRLLMPVVLVIITNVNVSFDVIHDVTVTSSAITLSSSDVSIAPDSAAALLYVSTSSMRLLYHYHQTVKSTNEVSK